MAVLFAVYLLMWLFIGIQYQRARQMERSVLGLCSHRLIGGIVRSLGFGMIFGAVLSGGMYALQHYFVFSWTVPLSWGVVALIFALAAIDVRLADIAFAGPVLVAASAVFQRFLPLPLFAPVPAADFRTLLTLTGAVQVVAGLIGMLPNGGNASPIYVQSRRGQVIGAFISQYFWAVPLFVPVSGVFVPLFALAGLTGVSIASAPAKTVRQKGAASVAVGLCTTAAAVIFGRSIDRLLVVALLSLLLRVLLFAALRLLEVDRLPIYVRPAKGVRILSVIARSPAAKLGIKPGEIIAKIGNKPVNSPYDIHFAIDQNPAYVKLEVIDIRGEARFVGTPLFADGPSQLGAVVVPDEHLNQYRRVYPFGRWNWIWHLWSKDPNRVRRMPQPALDAGETHPV